MKSDREGRAGLGKILKKSNLKPSFAGMLLYTDKIAHGSAVAYSREMSDCCTTVISAHPFSRLPTFHQGCWICILIESRHVSHVLQYHNHCFLWHKGSGSRYGWFCLIPRAPCFQLPVPSSTSKVHQEIRSTPCSWTNRIRRPGFETSNSLHQSILFQVRRLLFQMIECR